MRSLFESLSIQYCVVVLGGAFGSVTLQAQASPSYPPPTGAYEMGRVSFHWKDTARDELETKTAADKRELMVHVFYPREPGITAQRAEYLPDAEVLHGLWSEAFAARIRAMRSYSYVSAPIAKEARRYPVAVFLPGGGMKALMLTPEAIAAMSPDQQALYAARPVWAVALYAIAVWGGALGCVGLVMKKRWAKGPLLASLLGLIGQDIALFGMSPVAVPTSAYALQGMVLVIAVLLLLLANTAARQEWLS
ncbi:MAG: hypothetical protein IT353_07840 [Gemmatimonadaceae bacterium]|nr:hypothetical protein [Gemmatimonadaceae bacterium]